MAAMGLAKTVLAGGLAVGVALAAGAAVAQSAGAKAAIKRHESYEQLGKTFKTINDELKKDAPSKPLIAAHAARVKAFSVHAPSLFPKGSGKEAYPKSQALPAIWSDAAGFNSAMSKFQLEATKLNQVATGGDLNAIRAQVKATGGACQGCHKPYREKKS